MPSSHMASGLSPQLLQKKKVRMIHLINAEKSQQRVKVTNRHIDVTQRESKS